VATSPFNETYGVSGESRSSTGTGVYGIATNATGFTFGGNFVNNSVNGRGVRAAANATSGLAVGGRFSSASPNGMGVWSTASAGAGTTYAGYFENFSPFGYGVFANASATSTNTTYGVYGQSNSSSALAYGVWANGRLGASGTKSFRIDHPDDPENKYLLHYSTESPEVLNAYSGTITIDGLGEAVVELPHYFAKII